MGSCCSRCFEKEKRFNDTAAEYGSPVNHNIHTDSNNILPRDYDEIHRDKYGGYIPGPTSLNGGIKKHNQTEYTRNRVQQESLVYPSMPISVEPKPNNRISNFSQPGRLVFVTEPSESMYSSFYAPSSLSNLQHIAEREPDDAETDPSLNPTKKTMFMQHLIADGGYGLPHQHRLEIEHNRLQRRSTRSLQRSNSTSTIYLDDSTVSRPDPRSIVWALSYAVYLHIKNRDSPSSIELPEIFDETLHPIQKEPISFDLINRDPDHKTVHRFIRALFQTAQLPPECAIVTMVYLERLLTSAEAVLTPRTWRRAVLYSIILASKVWDDQAVWNVDYCQILKDLDVEDVNKMELQFLAIIQFNTTVTSSVYAKYYFDIRRLDVRRQPYRLLVDRARKLEVRLSSLFFDKIRLDTSLEIFESVYFLLTFISLCIYICVCVYFVPKRIDRILFVVLYKHYDICDCLNIRFSSCLNHIFFTSCH